MGVNVFVVIAIVVLMFIFSKQIAAFISSRQSTTTAESYTSEKYLKNANSGSGSGYLPPSAIAMLKHEGLSSKPYVANPAQFSEVGLMQKIGT
jgi:hypothetical protein